MSANPAEKMVLIVLLSNLAPGSGHPPEDAAMLVRRGFYGRILLQNLESPLAFP